MIDGETSDEVSPLRSRKSIGKESTFEFDQNDSEVVLEHLSNLVAKVLKRVKRLGLQVGWEK